MKVNLGGIVHLSTVDWPGRACMVVFLRGCPLRCPHCQNQSLWEGESPVDLAFIRNEIKKATLFGGKSYQINDQINDIGRTDEIDRVDQINYINQITLEESFLRTKSKPFISGFVLSGGDPLMQPRQAAAILGTAKSLGLFTGIETSGYYPDWLSELLKRKVADRVFLDIKAALKDPEYTRATGVRGTAKRVAESLEVCMRSGVPLEIRTTIFPEMPSFAELGEIAATLNKAKEEFPDHRLDCMVIQQGLPKGREFEPVPWDELDAMARYIDGLGGIGAFVRAGPKVKVKLDKVDSSEGLLPVDGSTLE